MKVFKIFGWLLLLLLMQGCSNPSKIESMHSSNHASVIETIPDSIVQFLIGSAATDFRTHQPPTATDFRNVKIGYIKSTDNQKIYILCGEFLSKENKEWLEFATIKTSGYEQYIGKTQYCEDAVVVLGDAKLGLDLKNKLIE